MRPVLGVWPNVAWEEMTEVAVQLSLWTCVWLSRFPLDKAIFTGINEISDSFIFSGSLSLKRCWSEWPVVFFLFRHVCAETDKGKSKGNHCLFLCETVPNSRNVVWTTVSLFRDLPIKSSSIHYLQYQSFSFNFLVLKNNRIQRYIAWSQFNNRLISR